GSRSGGHCAGVECGEAIVLDKISRDCGGIQSGGIEDRRREGADNVLHLGVTNKPYAAIGCLNREGRGEHQPQRQCQTKQTAAYHPGRRSFCVARWRPASPPAAGAETDRFPRVREGSRHSTDRGRSASTRPLTKLSQTRREQEWP